MHKTPATTQLNAASEHGDTAYRCMAEHAQYRRDRDNGATQLGMELFAANALPARMERVVTYARAMSNAMSSNCHLVLCSLCTFVLRTQFVPFLQVQNKLRTSAAVTTVCQLLYQFRVCRRMYSLCPLGRSVAAVLFFHLASADDATQHVFADVVTCYAGLSLSLVDSLHRRPPSHSLSRSNSIESLTHEIILLSCSWKCPM